MNKRYWISVALDDTLSDEEVLGLIERSWNLTTKNETFQGFSISKIFSTGRNFQKILDFS